MLKVHCICACLLAGATAMSFAGTESRVVAAVPEPSTAALLLAGLVPVLWGARRRRHAIHRTHPKVAASLPR